MPRSRLVLVALFALAFLSYLPVIHNLITGQPRTATAVVAVVATVAAVSYLRWSNPR